MRTMAPGGHVSNAAHVIAGVDDAARRRRNACARRCDRSCL